MGFLDFVWNSRDKYTLDLITDTNVWEVGGIAPAPPKELPTLPVKFEFVTFDFWFA